MSNHLSTRERLLAIVDDMEIISKEVIDNLITPKHQRTSDLYQLVELMLAKDEEMKELLKLAEEQEKIEETMNTLRSQVEKYDNEINNLQKSLKEAEQILSTAIFQAKQKLASINKANKRPIHTEEIIKFSHRISASHAISAPLTWQQGDLRRPYPTDIEMRLGFLGKNDLNMNGSSAQSQNLNDNHRNSGEIPASAQNQFAWHPSGELHMMSVASSGGTVSLDTRAQKVASQEQDDASSDSSSSSSSTEEDAT